MGKEATGKYRTKRPIIVWICKILKQMYLLSTFNKKVIGWERSYVLFMFLSYCLRFKLVHVAKNMQKLPEFVVFTE